MCADGRSGTEAVRTGGSHLSSACVVARGPQVPTPASPPRWSVCPAEACYSVSWGFLCSEQASILGTDRGFTLARPQLQVPSGPGQLPPEDTGLICRLGISPGRGHGNPLLYPCPENPMNRGAWWATVHGSQRVGHN